MVANFLTVKTLQKSGKYSNSLIWSEGLEIAQIGKTGIVIENTFLEPTFVDGIFYVENITAEFPVGMNKYTDKQTNEKTYHQTAELRIKSTNSNVEILADNSTINIDVDTNLDVQKVEFINFKTPLFKINNLVNGAAYDIVFVIIGDDSVIEVFYRFIYNKANYLGDVNGDGIVGLRDLVELCHHIKGIKDVKYPEFGDIDNDGILSMDDIVLLSDMILDND